MPFTLDPSPIFHTPVAMGSAIDLGLRAQSGTGPLRLSRYLLQAVRKDADQVISLSCSWGTSCTISCYRRDNAPPQVGREPAGHQHEHNPVLSQAR